MDLSAFTLFGRKLGWGSQKKISETSSGAGHRVQYSEGSLVVFTTPPPSEIREELQPLASAIVALGSALSFGDVVSVGPTSRDDGVRAVFAKGAILGFTER